MFEDQTPQLPSHLEVTHIISDLIVSSGQPDFTRHMWLFIRKTSGIKNSMFIKFWD